MLLGATLNKIVSIKNIHMQVLKHTRFFVSHVLHFNIACREFIHLRMNKVSHGEIRNQQISRESPLDRIKKNPKSPGSSTT